MILTILGDSVKIGDSGDSDSVPILDGRIVTESSTLTAANTQQWFRAPHFLHIRANGRV